MEYNLKLYNKKFLSSIFVKEEPELDGTNDSINGSSGNCTLDKTNEANDSRQETNRSCRRSRRNTTRNKRYKSDEEDTGDVSQNSFEANIEILGDDVKLQEPSSAKINMSRKQTPVDDPLKQILLKIGLFDELYLFLKSRCITAHALKYMQTRHIDELFNGTRLSTKIIFEHRLKEWQDKNENYEPTASNNSQLNSSINQILLEPEITSLANCLTNAVQQAINTTLQEFKASYQETNRYNSMPNNKFPISTFPLRNVKLEPNLSNDEIIIPNEISNKKVSNPQKFFKVSNTVALSNRPLEILSQPKKRKLDSEINVKEILSKSPFGQNVFDKYEKSNHITPNQQKDLVHHIVDYYIRKDLSITPERCKEIAEELVQLFPTESLETYFIQDNTTQSPKGIIWELYQVRKRSICKSFSLISRPDLLKIDPSISDTDDSVVRSDWTDMQTICSQMKKITNEKELLEKWKESFAFRRHQLQTGYFSNWKLYFDEYPFCKQQNYTEYIESDLETLYPSLKFNETLWDEFLKSFPKYFSKRIRHQKSKELYDQLIAMDNLSSLPDYAAIKVLELLHVVLKTNNKLESLEDAQRKFTVEVGDLSILKKVVIDRKNYCTENNIQAKPYIAVVGHNKTYSHFSVILDSTGFSCDNYKDSLILCFNLYLFFDISFSHESLNVWTFIQKYFFNKPPLLRNARVDSFINDIKGPTVVSSETKVNGVK